jgi:hypothetical protein
VKHIGKVEIWVRGGKRVYTRVELLPCFKFTGKMVKYMEFTGKIGKTGKR